jgi:hypothetical protein
MSDDITRVRNAVRRSTIASNEMSQQIEMELVHFREGAQDIQFNIDVTSETVWATQQQISELFGVDRTAIAKHLQNIFSDKELAEISVCAKIAQTAADGKTYQVQHYNLDAILSVGYRVSSAKATRFRQWANQTLRAYIVDGYVLNESRLRDDPAALRKLAAKIRELRSEEKTVYAQVRECFKISASDYDKESAMVRSFYAKIQDKFLFAVTGKTASELIIYRADHKLDQMGLQTVSGNFPTLQDASTGKNYLQEDEIYTLHILCEQFLLYAESKAIRGQTMTMRELTEKLDALLQINEYPVFRAYGDYLKPKAMQHAQVELALYSRRMIQERDRQAAIAAA